MINVGKLELLDNRRLVTQLSNLERRTSRSGKDSIDHPPSGKDDLANAAAGALLLAAVGNSAPNRIPVEVSPVLRTRFPMQPDPGVRDPGEAALRPEAVVS